MDATFKDVDKYLEIWKPETLKISKKEVTFYSNCFNFKLIPAYNRDTEEMYFEIEMESI